MGVDYLYGMIVLEVVLNNVLVYRWSRGESDTPVQQGLTTESPLLVGSLATTGT